MSKANLKDTTSRDKGSLDEFERDWDAAFTKKLDRYHIYPTDAPTTQFEMFEMMKSKLVMDILAEAGLSRSKVLEYGCGAAGMSIYLANQGFQVVACDLSVKALKIAKYNSDRHLSSDTKQNLSSLRADAFNLPFQDNSFDIVMSYGLLEHLSLEPLRQMLVSVVRVLRPGGLFIADIAHGRFSLRTVGIWLNLCGSVIYHFVKLDWRNLSSIPKAYLDHYYENDLDKQAWEAELNHRGLRITQSKVCHPLPPLALKGSPEHLYVALMRESQSAWEWYHRVQPTWGRNLGWLYLVSGTKNENE